MNFAERDIGDYRIYTGAASAPRGGYIAGVAVHRVRGIDGPPQCVFFDDRLADGVPFTTPAAALDHAMRVGFETLELMDSAH